MLGKMLSFLAGVLFLGGTAFLLWNVVVQKKGLSNSTGIKSNGILSKIDSSIQSACIAQTIRLAKESGKQMSEQEAKMECQKYKSTQSDQ